AEHTSENEPRITLAYAPDREGKLCVPGLRPSSGLEVRVEDKAGNVLISEQVEPEALDRNEEVVLRLDSTPRTLELVVMDARRAPIEGAEISRADGRGVLGRTDAS